LTSACTLDFDAFPYQPVGECVHPNDHEVTVWDNVRTTQCCRSVLYFFSKALARSASQAQAILLDKQQWDNCTSRFNMQYNLSIDSCKFDLLHQDNGSCSNLSLASIRSNYGQQFDSVITSCSRFDVPSFINQCGNCTYGISNMTEKIVEHLDVKDNDTQKAICSVVTIAAIASNRPRDDNWTDGYYRCLAAMDSDVVEVILGTLLGLIGLFLLVTLFKARKRTHERNKGTTTAPGKVASKWSGLYRFSKAEIEKAINYSSSRIRLGTGSAGQVYQGILPSGQLVAIKHLYKTAMNGSFTREVEGLSKVRHPNLVSLLGYCDENGDKYLVYEYCSNGNLAHNLLRSDALLPWGKRVKILRDCSLALRFLHTHPDGCIVHRDIKLANILLMDNMEPKLSDFGLARMVGMKETKCFTEVRGTIGYMDPEYMSHGNLSCASDIYSFGVVILQLLSGRKVIELDTKARETLTRKAKDVSAGKRPLEDFVDPRLEGELNLEVFKSILNISVLCVASSSKGRPTINDLVGEIERAYENTSANMVELVPLFLHSFHSVNAFPDDDFHLLCSLHKQGDRIMQHPYQALNLL
ncbi:unnamed protein product, partial [Musa acuminata subsp. burmannicoides]